MGKFVKFPTGPEIVGILLVVAAGAFVWKKFVPTNIKSMVS